VSFCLPGESGQLSNGGACSSKTHSHDALSECMSSCQDNAAHHQGNATTKRDISATNEILEISTKGCHSGKGKSI
jgi:hypothetical protein